MSGLETAIRSALDRSDRANPEIRARIYQSARQALEAGLRKQDITDVNVVAAQRQRLEATIREIEVEERARPAQTIPISPELDAPHVSPSAPRSEARPETRQAAAPPQEPVMSVRGETRDPPMSAGPAVPVEPMSAERAGREGDFGDMRAGPADHLGADSDVRPTADARPARSMNFKPERAAVRRKPRKFFSRLLVFCILLAFLGVGAWWIKTSGVLMSAAQRDTSVPNPPAHVDSQDFSGNSNDEDTSDQDDNSGPVNPGLATIDPQNSFSAEWLEVLKPTDAPKVATSPQSKAENVSENEGPAVRLTSLSSGPDGSGSIEVPVNVLQQMAGKASTIALTLQSTSDAPTQITVECDFGSLGRCGRHRFTVSRQKTDSLFQVKFDRAMAPTSSGRLIINSDVDGKARGVNIYAIRVLPGQ